MPEFEYDTSSPDVLVMTYARDGASVGLPKGSSKGPPRISESRPSSSSPAACSGATKCAPSESLCVRCHAGLVRPRTPDMDDVVRLQRRIERERAARQEAENIAEANIRTLYDRQNDIQLLRAVAVAANEASSVTDAMQVALGLVCEHSGWPIGHVFFVDDTRRLVSSGIWHDRDGQQSQRFAVLRHRTESRFFEPGVGLPGEVFLAARPVWIEDVTTYHNFPRARGGVDVGIRAAFGVPVLVGPAVQAVLEFFRENPAPLNAPLLDLMGQIGTMLGRVIERERSRSTLRETNLRLEQTLQELQATQRQVVQQERLRALGQMASGIAHDFGNALMPIMGYSELLLGSKKLAGDASATLWLRTILTAATDAAAVVSRLRQFYRTRTTTETDAPVNLSLLARQVVDLTHPVWVTKAQARGVHSAVDTDLPEVPPILGVESELRQAVINLVLNAIDAMPAGGTLLLKTRIAGDRVALDVRDTGIGMTEEMRQRCLEPFFTTKTDGTASGLGLGMVYGVVQRHHGRLDIDSAVGQGTTITLSFPAVDVSAIPPAPERARPAPSLRVLVVEDNSTARGVLVELLLADGHSVVTAANGTDALARLHSATFDLVLTDRVMPMMGGDELALRVKGSAKPVPVVMITGFGSMMVDGSERPPGVDVVLSKPVSQEALRGALAPIGRRRD